MLTSQSLHTMTIGLNTLCPKPGRAMSGNLKKGHASDSVIEKGRPTPPETARIFVIERSCMYVATGTLR